MVRVFGTAVFQRLGWALSEAALGTRRPWTIHLPDDAPEPLERLRTHVLHAVNARPREASDTIGMVLSVQRLRVEGDSLVAEFSIGPLWSCRDGSTGGHSTGYEVRSWRHNGFWQPPSTAIVLTSNSAPCGWRRE